VAPGATHRFNIGKWAWMSEYQYYEFLAVDRKLTPAEMRELRAVSTRAEITPTRFVNEYQWGDFKGDAFAWVEQYFDAFLYLANWGTRELFFRLPPGSLELETARRYCPGHPAAAEGEPVILSFTSELDGGDDEWLEPGGVLASIVAVRGEIASGDHRALYLGWLLCVWSGELADEELEPPVPPGLGDLTPAQHAFADFLRIDPDLIAAAAEGSASTAPTDDPAGVRAWVAALPAAEAADLLARVAERDPASVRAELLRRFREVQGEPGGELAEPRTVAELLEAAERISAERARAEEEDAAREQARRERAEAAARERRLDDLAEREEESWARVDELAGQKNAGAYDEAVRLLMDLREIAVRDGRKDESDARTVAVRGRHMKKRRFVERLNRALRSERPSGPVATSQTDLSLA
jgi:hypothetical protein